MLKRLLSIIKTPSKKDATRAGHIERMRIKLLDSECALLSEQEILEILMFLNYRRQNVKPFVKSLVSSFGFS